MKSPKNHFQVNFRALPFWGSPLAGQRLLRRKADQGGPGDAAPASPHRRAQGRLRAGAVVDGRLLLQIEGVFLPVEF